MPMTFNARPISATVTSALHRYDLPAKVPGFLADKYHQADEINSEKKQFQGLDCRDDMRRHAKLFNQIGEIIKQNRRAADQGEQDDAYDGMKSEPTHQFDLWRYGSLPPLLDTLTCLSVTPRGLTTGY